MRRCTVCAATSRTRTPTASGPPVVLVPPMMMSADVYDVTRDQGAVGDPARRGPRSVGGRLRLAGPPRRAGGTAPSPTTSSRSTKSSTGFTRTPDATSTSGATRRAACSATRLPPIGRSRNIASLITFGSPVDTLAALPFGIPAGCGDTARPISWPITSSTVSRSQAGWRAPDSSSSTRSRRCRSRIDFLRQLHDREALLPREPQRRFLDTEGWVAWSGPAVADLLQPVRRAQPHGQRGLRDQRQARDARGDHLPDPRVPRRSRRHRPASRGTRNPQSGAARRGLRILAPRGPFRSRRRIRCSATDVACDERMGAVAGGNRGPARRGQSHDRAGAERRGRDRRLHQ